MAKKVGRPKKWTSPTKMQKKIDEYFERCEGTMFTDEKGKLIFNKNGQVIYLNRKPPTITGLASFLGIESRSTFLAYQEDPEFSYTITCAKTRIEAYLEERLMDRDGQRGAEFNLKCNYGWSDRGQENASESGNQGVILIAPVLPEQEEEENESSN